MHGILTEDNGTTTGLHSPKSSSAHLQIASGNLWSQTGPRAWFSRLSGQLLKLSFTSSKADSSLFIYRT
jgi:hypothetical protein